MTVRRHARSLIRRRQVLDAALACFVEKGVQGTAIEDICTASGASVGSLYHLFDGKSSVAAAVYLDALEDFQAAVAGSVTAATGAREGVLAIVAAHIRWVEENPARARFLQQARHGEVVAALAADIAEVNRRFGRELAAWMAPHVAAGRLRALPLDLFIALLLGPAQEYVRGRMSGRDSSVPDDAIHELGAAAWRSLGRDLPESESR
ncbi:MAG: TetR/AcrR family transcriptional regulator [Steroidobacteraceae bacterium]